MLLSATTIILYSIIFFTFVIILLVTVLLQAKAKLAPSGPVTLNVNGEDVVVEAGSSLLFQASLSHCFCNVGQTTAQLIMLFYAGASNHLVRTLHMEASQHSAG